MKILEVFGEPILNGGQEAFVVSFVKEIDSEQFHFDLLTYDHLIYIMINQKKGENNQFKKHLKGA